MSKPKWTPIEIRLGDVIPWQHNPRMSTKAQAKRLIESEKEFGQPMPFSVSPTVDGKVELYDGHQRYSAWLTVYGEDYKVLASQSDRHLTREERQKFVITMHAGAVGSWDWQVVSGWDAPKMKEWGMDKDLLKGWNNDANNLKEMLKAQEPETVDAPADVDRAAELLAKWQVVTGDLWQIGDHRLICGDCTDAATVARVMGGERAQMVFTSPPYNGNTTMYDYIIVDGKKKRKDKTLYADNETDNKTSEDYIAFCHTVLGICFENTKGYIFWNINYNAKSRHEYIDSVYPFRDKLQETIVWKKQAIPTANGFTRNFEFIFMFKTDEDLGHLNKEYDIVHTVWEVNNAGSQEETHKACFPVGLPQKAIEISAAIDIVLDPFCGSGTTLVACQNTNRQGRGVEQSPSYVAVALERMATAFPHLEIQRI